MEANEIKKELVYLKKHVEQIELYIDHAREMIYSMQEKLFDLQDNQEKKCL
jgi:hypothetical protein